MALFSQILVIESPFPGDQVWKRLHAVVRSDVPICENCGQTFVRPGAGPCVCPRCGSIQAPPLPSPSLFQRTFLWTSNQGYEFEGLVTPQGFQISRIIGYRNSAVPAITGRYEPAATGTRIIVDIRMPATGYIFLAGGIGLPLIVAAAMSGDVASSGQSGLFLLVLAVPIFMFAVCWLMYRFEADAATGILNRIWKSPSLPGGPSIQTPGP